MFTVIASIELCNISSVRGSKHSRKLIFRVFDTLLAVFWHFGPKKTHFWFFDQKPPIPSDLLYFCPFILKISAKSLERFSRKIDFSLNLFWLFFDLFGPKKPNFWVFDLKPPTLVVRFHYFRVKYAKLAKSNDANFRK